MEDFKFLLIILSYHDFGKYSFMQIILILI